MSVNNCILIIADGMGFNQLSLGMLLRKSKLFLNSIPAVSLSIPKSVGSLVSDSASSGTALATGQITSLGNIGLSASGKQLPTIIDQVHEKNFRTAVVTNTRITSVTPACFYGHALGKRQEAQLSRQIAQSGIGYLFGGGARIFDREVIDELFLNDYEVVYDMPSLKSNRHEKILALLEEENLPYAIDRHPQLTLSAVALNALKRLAAGGERFFLVVESGRIDHACHVHDAATIAHEVIELDNLVKKIAAFPGLLEDTLVLITSDHTCGGLSIAETFAPEQLKYQSASIERIFAAMVHPSPEALQESVHAATGLHLPAALAASILENNWGRKEALGTWISQKSGVYFFPEEDQKKLHTNTFGHDYSMLPVFALGPQAAAFSGVHEQAALIRKVGALLDGKE